MGMLERDGENSYPQLDDIDEDPMHQVLGRSVSYREEQQNPGKMQKRVNSTK